MRIGFLLPANFAVGSPANGVLAQARFQAAALQRAGHEVEFMNPWHPSDLRKLDVVQFFMGGYSMFRIEEISRGLQKMRVWAPTIDTNEPNWRYRLAARIGSVIPKIHTIPAAYRAQGLGCDLVVVRSEHERDRIVAGLGIDRAKVELVLNGVEPPPAADPALARRELGVPEQYALHVSIYNESRKNVANLIRAVGPTSRPLIIAGAAEPGPGLDEVKALAAQYPSVRLLGFLPRETLNSLYAGATVFCLPSTHEGTGLVALEAATYGAKVVITRHGGPPDYFRDMAEYIDPGSVEGIRAAFLRAWVAPANNLREHVVKNLTWDQSASSLVAAYLKHGVRRG
ncbi:MAG: glycosyltransferase family 4 protein [Phycisphaerales bacterium]